MALPNPGMDAVPFTPLTAEFLDDIIENIESLSSGTGIGNKAVTLPKINGGTTAGVLATDASGNVESRLKVSAFVAGTKNTTSSSTAYTLIDINGGPSLTFPAVSGKKYKITIGVSYISAPSGEVNIQVLRPTDGFSLSAASTISGGNTPLTATFEYTENTTTNRTLVMKMGPQATSANIRTDNMRIEVEQIG